MADYSHQKSGDLDCISLSDLLPDKSIFHHIFRIHLMHIVESHVKDFVSEYDHKQKHFTKRDIIHYYDLFLLEWMIEDIIIDLHTCYKQGDLPRFGWRQVEKRLSLISDKLKSFIYSKVNAFEKDIVKFQRAFEQNIRAESRTKTVPKPVVPMQISLDIRFGIIKRANGKCEGCGASILEKEIEVCQIYENEEKQSIAFYAFCKDCRIKSKDRIAPEP